MTWTHKDDQILLEYGGWDVIATSRIYEKMNQELTSVRQRKLYEHNKALSRLAAKMHDVGFQVHMENWKFLEWGLELEYNERLQYLKDLVGISDFEGTENQMRALIWKRHATPSLSRFNLPDPFDERMWNDAHTLIKVDYHTLLRLVTNPGVDSALKEIIEAYWAADEVWKLRSTFVVSPLIKQAVGRDGRLRAGWNSLGADTGRWTCSSPNILNVKQFVRSMYCAAPGKVLVHADFSQQELWVMAAVASDDELFRRLQTGDVYTEDAKDWFGLPQHYTKKDLKGQSRALAKESHLARQYGAGDKTTHFNLLSGFRNLKFAQTVEFGKKFQKTYARTVAYWDEEMARIARCGYSETRIMQRRKVFPRVPERSQAVNYPIQGTAADISNLAVLELDRRCSERPGANVVHYFYDAVDLEVLEDDVDWAKGVMTEIMCTPVTVGLHQISIPIEIKHSTVWSDL